MLEIKNINISFNKKECIRNGHFQASPYQITGIYGESGTGKSSLLYIIGMLSDQQHDYYYHDELLKLDDKEKAKFRNEHISFITQNSLLIETISVEKNIEFYLLQSNIDHTVDELLDMVKMSDKKKAMPQSLSGGERQRIAIACAIAKDSDIILGDELTSALDEDNKKIIMSLLRECADQGKTVILVSHEKDIINECDRVYKLDHLELVIEKDIEAKHSISKDINIKRKVKPLKMFELLFHSNKKYNRRRIYISLLVMMILFMSVSMFVQGYHNTKGSEYSHNDVSKNKILVLSDNQQWLRNLDGNIIIRSVLNNDPIEYKNIENIEKLEHVNKVYDYYTFDNICTNNNGSFNEVSISVKRNGKNIEKKESSDEYRIDDYDYSVIPLFPEDKLYNKEDGVYVTSNLAYIYNIEIGDEIEVGLNVPYAMSKNLVDDESNEEQYTYDCITEAVNYKTKVIGITNSNDDYNRQVFMNFNIMDKFIREQIQRYKSGDIKVNEENFYEPIEDLKPYAKAVFVDKFENILNVQNEINNISEDISAYSEYENILEIYDKLDKEQQASFKIACFGSIVFMIGGGIIELFYIKKYKTTYMMMNLTGYDKKEKNKILMIHSLWQIMIILCLSLLIYITASLPDILVGLHIMNYEEIVKYISNAYNYYMVYCHFSKIHFILFGLLVILIVSIMNICMKKQYDKQDLVNWIREK